MLKVLTAEQMREVDRLTTERYGIPSILLMENAAYAVARAITEILGGSVFEKSILVLCGKGNNGGDGAAIGRLLQLAGADVELVLLGKRENTKGDARINFDAAYEIVAIFHELDDESKWTEWFDNSDRRWEGVVDAILGTGVDRVVEGFFRKVIEDVVGNNAVARFEGERISISVDLPSGLIADDAIAIGPVLEADHTVTFTAPKPANVLADSYSLCGQLIVSEIGSGLDLVNEQPSQLFASNIIDAVKWLSRSDFTYDSYKNKRGHAVLVAGSADYSGAAVMAGNSAIRSGAGLVTLATPKSCQQAVAARALPEVIVRGIAENEDGRVADGAFCENREMFEKADAIAIGCGLSATDQGVEKLFREIIELSDKPVIVDASALWFLNPPSGVPVRTKTEETNGQNTKNQGEKERAGWEPAFPAPLILTPHEGEFLRLLGTTDKEAIKDRVAAVREYSVKNNVILVLKGERVLIGEPGGKVVVNPTGNSGLGKAGNGDTLTGILAGFVAQAAAMKIDIFETVVAAVYVAGMAGDIAEKKFGKRVMTASDVRECLVDVFTELNAKS